MSLRLPGLVDALRASGASASVVFKVDGETAVIVVKRPGQEPIALKEWTKYRVDRDGGDEQVRLLGLWWGMCAA
jgi:hypothetical protein